MPFVPPLSSNYIHEDFYELLRYLGPAFNLAWCNASDQKGQQDASSGRYATNEEFIRNTLVFAYQSIGLMTYGIHRPYIAKLLELIPNQFPVTVLDYGAGGGQLGLALHTLGFVVSFADMNSQSLNFLQWRLRERRLNLPVYILDMPDLEIPHHDVCACFDVIEHCDPDAQLSIIHKCAEIGDTVFVNLIRDDREKSHKLHFPIDMDGLTNYVSANWPTWYQDYYPDDNGVFRQRLLIYGEGVKLNVVTTTTSAV